MKLGLRPLRLFLLGLCLYGLTGCIMPPVLDDKGKVYHCVGTAQPIPPPNIWGKNLPLEKFEYGSYYVEDRPTISGTYYCNVMLLPSSAYLRYQLDGQVVEKHFDLSSLTPSRVYKKTVEFYVDNDTVEVRLVTEVDGTWPIKEVVTKQ